MRNVDTYKVLEKVSAETSDPILGRCSGKFDAGDVKPKNEKEEAVLRFLVDQGLAEVVDKSKKKSAAKSAPATDDSGKAEG